MRYVILKQNGEWCAFLEGPAIYPIRVVARADWFRLMEFCEKTAEIQLRSLQSRGWEARVVDLEELERVSVECEIAGE